MSTYPATRLLHQAHALEQLSPHLDQLSWSQERLRQHRQQRLRRLLELARQRSPWHRQRLAHLDLERLDESQLGAIPAMTKGELMAHFDEIVTAPQLTLRRVEDHLGSLQSDAYLLDRYHAVASGGSSGRRGVYVYDWDGWVGWYLTVMRRVLLALRADRATRSPAPGEQPNTPIVAAVVMGERATHVSSAAAQTFRELSSVVWNRVSVLAPWSEQLAKLAQLQPQLLATYPSFLRQLLLAQERGELRIAPRLVLCSAEPLLASVRAEVERVWGCPVLNCWASSEAGGMGVGCGQGSGLHLSDDTLLIEPVDREGRPVPAGVRSSKVYVTNLFNDALPLIRFELSDELTIAEQPCPCGSAHRLAADIEGRLDDSFEYPGLRPVHPQLFRSRLGRERQLIEYQVRQLPRGVDVNLQLLAPADLEQIRADLILELTQAGLDQPQVIVRSGQAFERTVLGKLKRFIPLPEA